MSDNLNNLIELPKLIEEKIISYRKYYILENISPFIPKNGTYYEMVPDSERARFSAIYDERHVGKMVNYLTTIFQKAFDENRIDNIRIEYLAYGDQYNEYCNIEDSGEYYDTAKIEETEIISFLANFGNLRIKGRKCNDEKSMFQNMVKLDYIIREIDMNNNPIDISQSDEQLENEKKWKKRMERLILESEESS